jgi:thymidylate synthase (FAD)
VNKIDVLDLGYVRLVDHMGSDLEVVNDARVSFDQESWWGSVHWDYAELKPEDSRLINYLARPWHKQIREIDGEQYIPLSVKSIHDHWMPFAHQRLKFEIEAPLAVIGQWFKARIGNNYTEQGDIVTLPPDPDEAWSQMSLRYRPPHGVYVPSEWRGKPKNAKQGSTGTVDIPEGLQAWYERHVRDGLRLYGELLNHGAAPEQARFVLPEATYSKFRWSPSLYRVITWLQLRTEDTAQWEIRQYGNAVSQLVKPLFPRSLEVYGL